MAKYCTWCGEPVDPGERYCGSCGGRLLDNVMVDGKEDVSNDLRGLDVVAGEEIPPDTTARFEKAPSDTDTLVLPTDHEQKKFVLGEDGAQGFKHWKALIGVAAVLIAGALGLGWFSGDGPGLEGLLPAFTNEASSEQVDATEGNDAQNAAQEGATPSATISDRTMLTDSQAREKLSAAYDRIARYSERIIDCADDFNGYFLAKSLDDRTVAKEKADTVLAELEGELADLQKMQIAPNSKYADDLALIIEMYECEIGRIQALTDAWALDVTFETPSQHKQEILDVLGQYNEYGQNKYLTRFDEIYWGFRLTD